MRCVFRILLVSRKLRAAAEGRRHKATYIKEFTDGDIDSTESQTLSDESVIVDRDTAVIVGTDTASGTEKGSPYRVVFRYPVTYVHRQGHWLALAEHLVEVPSGR